MGISRINGYPKPLSAIWGRQNLGRWRAQQPYRHQQQIKSISIHPKKIAPAQNKTRICNDRRKSKLEFKIQTQKKRFRAGKASLSVLPNPTPYIAYPPRNRELWNLIRIPFRDEIYWTGLTWHLALPPPFSARRSGFFFLSPSSLPTYP